jgi:hypothetical protein
VIFRRTRWTIAGVLAALITVCGISGWVLPRASTETRGMLLSSYKDSANRLAVEFPVSWHRAGFPMFAPIVNPKSILTLSTFAIPRGAGQGECGSFPSQVLAGVGRAGAAVMIYELYRSPGGYGPKLIRQTPKRPAVFHLDKSHGVRMPGASEQWLFQFKEEGRLLTAAVVLGPAAPPALRRDAIRILDGLRIAPRTGGSAS